MSTPFKPAGESVISSEHKPLVGSTALESVLPQYFEDVTTSLVAIMTAMKSDFFQQLCDAPDGLTEDLAVACLHAKAPMNFGFSPLLSLVDNGLVFRKDGKIMPTDLSRTLLIGAPTRARISFFIKYVLIPCVCPLTDEEQFGRPLYQAFHNTDKDIFGFLNTLEDKTDLVDFHQIMDAFARDPGHSPDKVLREYDWSQVQTVLDVGGSLGHISRMIAGLPSAQHCRFIVQDLPEVIDQAMRQADMATETHQISFEVRDFRLPDSKHEPDVILLSRILHDWNDDDARDILRNVTKHMRRGQKLLILETVLDEVSGSARRAAKSTSLVVSVLSGGRERTKREWERMIAAANPRLSIQEWRVPPNSMACMIVVEMTDK
ncbi:O-methyltransferase domain-containing protein 3 [Elsinoe fawcettii]|nr:O-methyltransferase domain-containing protein 3 [Elsinoe fawcettii]